MIVCLRFKHARGAAGVDVQRITVNSDRNHGSLSITATVGDVPFLPSISILVTMPTLVLLSHNMLPVLLVVLERSSLTRLAEDASYQKSSRKDKTLCPLHSTLNGSLSLFF
ncbi:hypothetical protein EVAR_36256_1 [Eumeta japonica]|uniref:Uncharacterized protein n=1 Tax=Eumeta variegata TaxID=151549 RepID=A0A4C1WXA9_EUMVA|nr:hypothetical protein EVAR_36256_1 [Eumeta japonica]